MDKKFKDLDASDNIETIASTLRSALAEYQAEYEKMKSDGVIDDEELNRIITTMQELEFKARTLKTSMTAPNEIQIMDEIINIINAEQVKMTNIKNNPMEEVKTESVQMEM